MENLTIIILLLSDVIFFILAERLYKEDIKDGESPNRQNIVHWGTLVLAFGLILSVVLAKSLLGVYSFMSIFNIVVLLTISIRHERKIFIYSSSE